MHGAMEDGAMKDGMKIGMKDGAMAHGATFMKGTKGCTGSYTIGEDQGQQVLTFSKDFSIENSPTPYVILSTTTGLGDAPVWLGAVQLGRGTQRYIIPKGTNLSHYTHVVIWDKTTNATLASADLASGSAMMSDQ
ncbi:MAG TPA: DM13 domain-containing protein [Gemmatimonadaceae bacterium]|nr:DM13 domain-containing protein [Gemmatimonadaceae bacterium]